MNSKKFSQATSEIDPKYIDETLNYKKKVKKPHLIQWGAMAACLCLVLSGGFVYQAENRYPLKEVASTNICTTALGKHGDLQPVSSNYSQ